MRLSRRERHQVRTARVNNFGPQAQSPVWHETNDSYLSPGREAGEDLRRTGLDNSDEVTDAN